MSNPADAPRRAAYEKFFVAAALLIVLVVLIVGLTERSGEQKGNLRTTSAARVVDSDIPPDVVISEFLASNRGGLRDEDGETPGWVELYNRGSEPVDLNGWTLSDDARRWDKWILPSVVLPPEEYLVIFASGKDRRADGEPLHTNFRLNVNGEFLGLFAPDGEAHTANAFYPRYPEQRANVAYGRVENGSVDYVSPPTPGVSQEAATRLGGLVPELRFSRERGHYSRPFKLRLHAPTPGAAIWYTRDGSEPGPQRGVRYAKPVRIDGTTVVRAVAVRDGWSPSPPAMHTYIFPDDVKDQERPPGYSEYWGERLPADYAMDPTITSDLDEALRALPTLSVAIDPDDLFDSDTGIYMNTEADGVDWERPAAIDYVDAETEANFSTTAGIRMQGRSSRKPHTSPKHSFRILFKAAYGPGTLTFPLFGEDGVQAFNTLVLRATSNYSWTFPLAEQRTRALYIRDPWASDTQRAMGHESPRSTFAHLYLNGLYWGVYCVSERPDAAYMATHFGGAPDEYDVLKGGEIVAGDDRTWRRLLRIALDAAEDPSAYARLADLLDVDNFIDYMILNQYAGNENWDYGNWYAARRRAPGGKFRFFCWDMESILGRVGESKLYVRNRDRPTDLFHRLLNVDAFRTRYAQRINRHLTGDGALTPRMAAERLIDLAAEIDEAIVAESARWGDYRLAVHPYRTAPFERYTRDGHWQPELERLLTDYFPKRTAIVLDQYRRAGLVQN